CGGGSARRSAAPAPPLVRGRELRAERSRGGCDRSYRRRHRSERVVEVGAPGRERARQDLGRGLAGPRIAEVAGGGDERAPACIRAREAKPFEQFGDEVQPTACDTVERGLDGRMVGGREQRELDPVACSQRRDALDEQAKLLARIRRGSLDLC